MTSQRGVTTLVLAASIAMALAGCGKKEEAPQPSPSATAPTASEIACSYAPSQSAVVSHLSGIAGGSAAAAAGVAKAAGLTAVMHSSGAYIFTGSAGYVAGTLGTAIVAPVLVGAGVVVGGSAATLELLCAPKNHPEFAAKIDSAATEFFSRSKASMDNTVPKAQAMAVELQKSALRTGNDAIDYANRSSVAVSEAFRKLTN